jgi:formaldehyde-activating enzyme involved in methanogenesis
MKNKSNKGVIIIDGKEKWQRKEAINATKLIIQRMRKVLQNKMMNRNNLDAFGNSDLELAKVLCKEMLDDILVSISNMTLPKKYANRKIYKECLKAFKEGIKKNM